MSLRTFRHTAIGTALALAVTLTSTIGPALAATPWPAVTPTSPDGLDPGIVLTVDQPQSSGVTFLPDVRVNYLGKTAGSGGKVTYRFRVQNIGAASASNVGLGTVIGQDANSASISTRQEGSAGTIATLGEDQSKDIAVVCTPLPGYHCAGASLKAYVTDDLDTSNNAAHSS